MSTYQLTFLLNEEKELEKLNELISSFSAKIIKEEKWGKKTLAYAIKKNSSAFFYNYTIDVQTSKVNDLRRKLNYYDKLIRFLLLKD